jgi:hypothetical protein
MKSWLQYDADVPGDPLARAIYILATSKAEPLFKEGDMARRVMDIVLRRDDTIPTHHLDGRILPFNPGFVLQAGLEESHGVWWDVFSISADAPSSNRRAPGS